MDNDPRPTDGSSRDKLRQSFHSSSPDEVTPRPAPYRLTLTTTAFSTFVDFVAYHENMAGKIAAQEQYELQLITGAEDFTAPGYCFPCGKAVDFLVDYLYSNEQSVGGLKLPNWRERVLCPQCGLNSRIRASVHFLEETLGCSPESSIYISEQTTPLYAYLKAKYVNLVGSEYLGNRVKFGETDPELGLRNESITKLSFPDNSFDFVLSFDVFEHVPDYHKALRECLRVLKPGGHLLFTVPFRLDREDNLVRAIMDRDGKVEHLMEPEYHGDPISNAGCLCFYHFGWRILDELKHCGFHAAAAHLYWSDTLGYLGQYQTLFCARKAAGSRFWNWLFRSSR